MPGSAEQRRKELAWQDGKAVGNRLYRGDDFVGLRRVFLVSPLLTLLIPEPRLDANPRSRYPAGQTTDMLRCFHPVPNVPTWQVPEPTAACGASSRPSGPRRLECRTAAGDFQLRSRPHFFHILTPVEPGANL